MNKLYLPVSGLVLVFSLSAWSSPDIPKSVIGVSATVVESCRVTSDSPTSGLRVSCTPGTVYRLYRGDLPGYNPDIAEAALKTEAELRVVTLFY